MRAARFWLMGTGVFGAVLLGVLVVMQPTPGAGAAQTSKPVKIHRFFTGPDGLTHAEEIEVKFESGDGGNGLYKLLSNSNAVLRRSPPSSRLRICMERIDRRILNLVTLMAAPQPVR